ncbi:DUF885 domain-containing protein [Tersicoccus sp. Bi-70]|uniref:DUF885 domain-containing protein n=1 Tax=Tersicoccus sp. Bi-70 TaxID=1897634 RepID=UPI00097875FD|nr:DUF885 domain-containing protein [Tersicoccus sp. Bi-70]OMH31341.1 hypothetical protein BGP79_10000 [Tersicoccus sp. Bi-70]
MTDTTRSDAPRTPTTLDELANGYTQTLFDLDPAFATVMGKAGHETEYRDYSPDGYRAAADAARQTRDAAAKLRPEDDVDVVTLDALDERLGLALEIHDAGHDIGELNNIASPAQEIRSVLDLMPTETAEQWSHIAGRLANIPAALDGYVASLRDAAGRGEVAAVRQVDTVVEQIGRYVGDEGYFASLVSGARTGNGELPGSVAADLERGADAARAGYAKLRDYLATELRPVAPTADAVGRERYALHSRQFLGSAVDLDETYAWGVAELDRIIAEQEEVAGQIKAGAGIPEAIEVLNADPARQLDGTDALRAWMQSTSDDAVAALAGTHFEIPEIMRTLECMIAPTQEGGIYYTPPADDFSRPGRMWWSVPAGETTFTTWKEKTTVYHEGVPGHHLQMGYQTMKKDVLNDWRRSACWVSGHGEGWALYAERLMADLGYLDDPGDRLGMLDAQRMRAARVVFDLGVHLQLPVPERWGTGTWDADNGRAFLRKNIAISEGQLDFEWTRYLGWPGQAPAYKIGQRLWEQTRDEVRAREGDAFDLKAFHTRALSLGSVGLDTLRRALLPAA